MSEWIKTEDALPETDVPVWAFEFQSPYLAELQYIDEGLVWVRVYGEPYVHEGKWKSPDTEYGDDYNPSNGATCQSLPRRSPHDRPR